MANTNKEVMFPKISPFGGDPVGGVPADLAVSGILRTDDTALCGG